jgi:plastocyanin
MLDIAKEEAVMKKTYIYIAIVAVIVLGGVGIYFAMNQKNTDNNMNSMDMNNSSNDSASSAVETDTVSIKDFAFSPVNISVKAGTKVTWTNNDSAPHTVTETDGKTGPSSGNLSNGDSYSFTFTKPGIYHYDCSIHPNMTGTVTVN